MTFPYNVSKTPAFSTDPYHPLFAPWCCLRVRAGWEILGKFSFFFSFFFFPWKMPVHRPQHSHGSVVLVKFSSEKVERGPGSQQPRGHGFRLGCGSCSLSPAFSLWILIIQAEWNSSRGRPGSGTRLRGHGQEGEPGAPVLDLPLLSSFPGAEEEGSWAGSPG